MPSLTPDGNLFRPVALLKQGQGKTTALLHQAETGLSLVSHRINAAPRGQQERVHAHVEAEDALLTRLHHANLPVFHSVHSTPQGLYFLFNFVDGYPLNQYQGSLLPTEWVLWWWKDILVALTELARLGKVVGGIDPSDLLVFDAHLVLTDLGLMETVYPEAAALGRTAERMQYMAPEERHATQGTAEGDLYAGASVAWWMLTGEPPLVNSSSDAEQLARTLQTQRPDLVGDVSLLLGEMLQYHASHRLASPTQALDRLALHVHDLSGSRPPSPPIPYTLQLLGHDTRVELDLTQQQNGVGKKDPTPPTLAIRGSDTTRAKDDDTLSGRTQVDLSAHSTVARPFVPPPKKYRRRMIPAEERASAIPWRIFLVSAATVLVLGGLVLSWLQTRVPSSSLLHVAAGRLSVHHPGQVPEWSSVVDVQMAGMEMRADQPATSTELRFGSDSHLLAEPSTLFRLQDGWRGTLKLELLQGSLRLVLDAEETVVVAVPGAQAECVPGSAATFMVSPTQYLSSGEQIQVERGTLGVQVPRQANMELAAGHALATHLDGPNWVDSPAVIMTER